jgi:3-hydroxybutyryl-CoA dehydratase
MWAFGNLAATIDGQAMASALGAIEIGTSHTTTYVVSDQDLIRFAELSGDANPVHLDDRYAQERGFPRRIAYGGLIVAWISELVGMRLPGQGSVICEIALRFAHPMHVGDRVEVSAVVNQVSP